MDIEQNQRVIRSDKEPFYPQFSSQASREKTFKDHSWSHQLKPNPQDLAEAGFFYSGLTDGTICFCCGKGLYEWLETDDPFVEHVKHSPRCSFLEVSKGSGFMTQIKNMLRRGQNDQGAATNTSTANEEPLVEITPGKDCLICTTRERQIAFQPCGHLATCISCTYSSRNCCICRTRIINRVRIFMP